MRATWYHIDILEKPSGNDDHHCTIWLEDGAIKRYIVPPGTIWPSGLPNLASDMAPCGASKFETLSMIT